MTQTGLPCYNGFMKAKDVVIGGTYEATVSGKRVKVRVLNTIIRTSGLGMKARDVIHYKAINLSTNRLLELRSAQRLRPLRAVPTQPQDPHQTIATTLLA